MRPLEKERNHRIEQTERVVTVHVFYYLVGMSHRGVDYKSMAEL